MNKPNIIISLPIVWSIRNIFYSGLTEKLNKNYSIYYLVPDEGRKLLIEKLGINPEYIILYPELKINRVSSLLNQTLQLKFSRKSPPGNKFFKKFNTKKSGLITSTIRNGISYILELFLSEREINRIINQITKRQTGQEHFKIIKAVAPDFILSTTHVTEIEKYYFPVYADLNYRVYAAILSFDNILSRGYVRLNHFNKILVWNSIMKEEAVKYYNIPAANIFITGSPQFELNKQGSQERARVKLKLRHDDLVILYCANHYIHTPTEPLSLKQIIKQAAEERNLKNYKWVIRLHPLDDFNRWDSFRREMPGVIVNEPWVKSTNSHFWDLPSKEDFLLLGELLSLSSVILNMASTTTLDAISINKPVVCIGFSTIDPTEGKYYFDCHFSEHFKLISSSESIDLATGMEDLFIKLKENILDPDKYKIQRERLAQSLLGVSGKDATDLICEILTK